MSGDVVLGPLRDSVLVIMMYLLNPPKIISWLVTNWKVCTDSVWLHIFNVLAEGPHCALDHKHNRNLGISFTTTPHITGTSAAALSGSPLNGRFSRPSVAVVSYTELATE